jgi:hypothetical protein
VADKNKEQSSKKKRGFFARVFRFLAFVALLAGVGIFAGFKVQKSFVYQGETVQAGQWAWENTDGFVKYVKHWTGKAKKTGTEAKNEIVAFDSKHGISTKIKQGASSALASFKARFSPEESQQVAKQDHLAITKQRESNYGYSDAEVADLPAGYYEAVKQGYAAYQEATIPYANSYEGQPNWQENAKLARAKFGEARGHFERAKELDPNGRLSADIDEKTLRIQEYIYHLTKDKKISY